MMRKIKRGLTWAALVLGATGCGGPPQMGGDAEAFQAVDALYTAVGMRDPAGVRRCCARLRALRDASKLPVSAFAPLESVIEEAGSGGWEPALERLGRFMEGQRR